MTKTTNTKSNWLTEAMEVTSRGDAVRLLENYVVFIQRENPKARNGSVAMKIAKSNIGYFAGYYGPKIRERVERLFMCEHPVFGSIAIKGSPTEIEAFNAGMKIGKRMRKKAVKL